MKIRNTRMFPHPVLSSMHDDYVNCEFKINVDAEKTKKQLIIKVNPSLKSSTLCQMIYSKLAKIVLHLECGKTRFRKLVELELNKENTIVFPSGELNEDLQIVAFVIANDDIRKFKAIDNEFNSDYGNISFEIEKGTIWAISNQLELPVKKDIYDLSNINSIVSIISAQTDTNKMSIELLDTKIRVSLPKETFIHYCGMGKTENAYTPILYSMFVIPAITYAIDYLQSIGPDHWIDIERFLWFRVIKKKCEEKYGAFDENIIKKYTSVKIAQDLIDDPIPIATSTLLSMEVK